MNQGEGPNNNAREAAAAIPAAHQDPVLAALLEQLHDIAGQSGYDVATAVDLEKARNVLEATAGDVHLAAQLYWDDFLATQAQLPADPPPPEDDDDDVDMDMGMDHPHDQNEFPEGAEVEIIRRPEDHPVANDDIGADNNNNNEGEPAMLVDAAAHPQPLVAFDDDDEQPSNRGAAAGNPIRRSLERAFDLHLDEEDHDDDPPAANANAAALDEVVAVDIDQPDAVPAGFERIIARARDTVRRLEERANNNNNNPDNNVEGAAAMAARAAEAFLLARRMQQRAGGAAVAVQAAAAAAAEEGSVSVSDDETGGVWKMVGEIAANLNDQTNKQGDEDADGAAAMDRGPAKKRHKSTAAGGSQKENEVDEKKKAGDSDDDATSAGYLSDNDWLWESTVSRSSIPLCPPVDLLWGLASSDASSNTEDADAASNVIADDEEEAANIDKTGVPHTWLNAGFYLSECTSGVALKPPSEDDIAYFAWRQQSTGTGNSRNTIPPPYHCRGITSLLSIVTGLLYTGATIQGKEVTCHTLRIPFVELSADERRREFESRLADALSALLFIATRSSLARKKAALTFLQKSKDDADKRKWQTLQGKLRVCPTCFWEQDPATGEVRVPEADSPPNVFVSSYTNIEDLRAYVLSNMRSFTSSGGCALFLETIMRIHGRGAVARMVRRARRQAKLPVDDPPKSLISCTCEERHKKEMDDNPPSMKVRRSMNVLSDTTPPGHECVTTELVSLLLTGRISSILTGWSSRPLGVGLLSSKFGDVGRGLSRPDEPVWILRGPTCYSVLWLNESKDQPESFSVNNTPGTVAEMTHWNTWYGTRNKTDLRLIIGRSQYTAPTFENSSTLDQPSRPHDTVAALILRRRRDNRIAYQQRESTEPPDPDLIFSDNEYERIVVNVDDQKFYSGKYRMWRYDMGCSAASEDERLELKQRADVWTPFHRLSKRQQLMVESKLGPKINTIMWTRWPRATIDKFSPDITPPIV